MPNFSYPKVRRDEDFKEDFHGQTIADPYHWLSDPDSKETQEFVEAQNKLTVPYLESVPERGSIKASLTRIMDYPKYGCPRKKGTRYFYRHNTGLQNQGVIYVQDSLDGEPRVFLDPNLLSEDGCTAITVTEFTKDGSLMAYGISESGSDWFSIKVKEAATAQDLPDVVSRAKFSSVSWTHDNKGFFYSSYPRASKEGRTDGTETTSYTHHKVLYHRLGTPEEEDLVCVEFPEHPTWLVGAEVSDCGRLLIVSAQEQCKDNQLYYIDLASLSGPNFTGPFEVKQLTDKMDAVYNYITNVGDVLTVLTDKNAPMSRLVNIDIHNPAESNWQELVPEKEDLLEWAVCVAKDKLVVCYQRNVRNLLMLSDLKTGQELEQFPIEIGTVSGFFGEKDLTEIFVSFISFLTPGTIYRCDLAKSGKPTMEVFREIKVAGLDTSTMVAKQEYYTSKDGTRVPMFLVHSKDMEVGKPPAPCLLYGYGGFNISLLPTFNPVWLLFVKHMRGVFAMANIRGGGEFGTKWHEGGKLFNKQNSFNDFIAAAEHICGRGYSEPSKLVIQGASNGGLLTAATLNQAPDKIGCAIIQVGVLDMLRFHRYTIGKAWASDYGNSDENKHFENLIKISPLHNVRAPSQGQYPPTLLLTADHDDRVVPLHTLKFIAELQHTVGSLPSQTNPLLVRVDTKAGHGGGKPTSKIIDEYVDIFSFIIKSMGIKYYEN